jgi:hypothetical protein
MKYFTRIKDPKLRRSIVNLVEQIARAPRTMTIFSSDRSPARRDGDFGS